MLLNSHRLSSTEVEDADVTADRPVDLLGLTLPELEQQVETWGQPRYRARQIFAWLHRRDAVDVDQMTDLPAQWRRELAARSFIRHLPMVTRRQARDGTQKLLLAIGRGESVETVLIPDGNRRTACVSSQAGCGMGCTFCATGLMGLRRNLTTSEIVEQVRALRRHTGERITHLVLMGMGEPLANYGPVVSALRIFTDPMGMNLSPRRITVSTVGLVPQIRRLAREGLGVRLAVSLHAADDATRDQLVPINRRWPISQLLDACRDYIQQTGRRVSFEYTLLAGVNDSPADARRLADLLKGMLCHVNLIPVNPVPETGYQRPHRKVVARFLQELQERGIASSVRKEKGTEIEAACGQLRRTAPEGSDRDG